MISNSNEEKSAKKTDDFKLSDLCKCGHTYGSHPFLKIRTEGFPMPPAYSCISCKCQKFELSSKYITEDRKQELQQLLVNAVKEKLRNKSENNE
ncbi:hypothetical protein A3B05_00025 [Candidatus Giovannonibacteria bacterium RIFCSPLOWO2_01_FULL_43_160]|uniref:Uncharacterized protein n=2 Tax=Candidatus Giovannoniibacteriota TaxID=1752738 RepID=A0A0G1IXT9_9BACT|nr:MAG: hypothetical protein UV72_C0001G0064 [Candidatus Giovannonibacteria bacterium GW2011_GWB1_43_13]KKS99733.1 MAG: hypothetical protein UV75_C0002G0114 [Candidatus Giovannonibacteria bacterium GW2011_GWA1_43_15]KKT21857.1 MAG: hypothetical protein UW05_C0001G0004 [Candidatus Giovannonibacteria bacterium GW2011_GWC2_43_8]KKT63818.1 MAG: hypothetical protein UW55_C0001G0111 [Candidatus Giovannonibacteria bacterium GW2011_GWA2_44_26]OGF58881.1 MAG: hypothetical protein A2652_03435 [Candidatus